MLYNEIALAGLTQRGTSYRINHITTTTITILANSDLAGSLALGGLLVLVVLLLPKELSAICAASPARKFRVPQLRLSRHINAGMALDFGAR